MDFNFPKIELHRHIEGDFHLPTLFKMAKKNGLDFPTDYDSFKVKLQYPKDAKPNFALFLSKFFNTWYSSLDDVAEVVYHSIDQMGKEDNLFYLEQRFNPYHYCINKGFDPVDAMKTFLEAANSAIKNNNYYFKHLITFNRGFHTPQEMIDLLKRFVNETSMDNVVGIDIAGDEINYPPELFVSFFDYVHSLGFKATVHAGEVTGPDQIWTAVEHLHAARVGHGVSTIYDEKLQDYLKEHEIALEMCLTSNYQTGAWSDYTTHPVSALLRQGLLVTLNSDDPTVQDSLLSDDYKKAHQLLNFSLNDFRQVNINAIKASFLLADEKNRLMEQYLKVMG